MIDPYKAPQGPHLCPNTVELYEMIQCVCVKDIDYETHKMVVLVECYRCERLRKHREHRKVNDER